MGQAESRAYWKCKGCNFTIHAGVPPENCPVCRNTQCKFKDITCYLPECGGPAFIDPRLK
jgi:rubrerythrin